MPADVSFLAEHFKPTACYPTGFVGRKAKLLYEAAIEKMVSRQSQEHLLVTSRDAHQYHLKVGGGELPVGMLWSKKAAPENNCFRGPWYAK